MVDELAKDTRENVRSGLAHVANAYGMDAKSKKYALALGLNSQQALQKIMKNGGARTETMTKIIERTGVSRNWLFDREGQPFPKGLIDEFGTDQSGANLEVDVDVLRNLVSVLTAALVTNVQDADETILSGLSGLKYSDRGFYRKIKKTIADAQQARQAALASAARAATRKSR